MAKRLNLRAIWSLAPGPALTCSRDLCKKEIFCFPNPGSGTCARFLVSFHRCVTLLFPFLLLVMAANSAAQQSPPRKWGEEDRNRWLADFQQLREEMSAHYANLEWAVNDRRMDLPSLRSDTEKSIREARSPEEEQKAFQRFLNAFGDGHLNINWQQENAQQQMTSTAPKPLCERLGYVARSRNGVQFSLLPGFQAIDDEDALLFQGGILRLQNGPAYGVIRFPSFSEHDYPQACEEAVQQLSFSDAERDSCKPDGKCEGKVRVATGNVVLRALERRIASLQKAGAQRMVVDITGNGGGSNWVDAVVRTISPVALRDMRLGFLKHPHWSKDLEEILKDVHADLQKSPKHREVLTEAAKRLQGSLALTKEECDRSTAWTTGKLSCSSLVRDQLYFSGILPYAKPGEFAELESRQSLFHALEYDYRESVNSLPLLVLVNGNTWSAAEYFAAILQDNKAAKIIGQLTGGAGCGYTNGGIPMVLQNSGAQVEMPDCVRLRADGSNEVEGITPDELVPWAGRDSPYQQAHKLVLVLQSMN